MGSHAKRATTITATPAEIRTACLEAFATTYGEIASRRRYLRLSYCRQTMM